MWSSPKAPRWLMEQTVVQLSAQRLAASVSLIKALGAGWTADNGQAAAQAGKQ